MSIHVHSTHKCGTAAFKGSRLPPVVPETQLFVTNPQVNAHVLSSYHCEENAAGRELGVPGSLSIEGRPDRRAARGTACCRSDKCIATDRSLSHLLVTPSAFSGIEPTGSWVKQMTR